MLSCEGSLLSIDLGTSAVKALVFDLQGNVLAQAQAGYQMSFPRPNCVEQDPQEWWAAVCKALHELKRAVPLDSVKAVGLSGQMKGLVLLSHDHVPVRPCIVYTDSRSANEAACLKEHHGTEIFQRTGGWVRTPATVTKLMWVKQYEPSVWESAETFVLPKDYVRLRLTGVACTEPTDAAGTLLFDIHTGSWMYDLAEQLGLTDLTLPPIAHSHVPVGYITPLAAQETGIPVGIPVVGGASDMACTVLGGGLMAEGDTSITLSTAAQVLTAIEQPMHAKFQGTSYNLHAQAGLGFLMGSIYAGGYSYKWIRDLLKLQAVTHAELEEQVKQVKPGCDGLLYLPHILGAGTPTFDPAFRGAFLEVSAYHTPFHFVRAAMEGVAFQIRECVELVENAGVSITTCLIGAGGSRNSLWRQIIADVLNRPLRVPSCLDLSGMGAAILAGVGAEIYPDLQAGFSAMVQITGVVEPQESNRAAYNDQYERFRDYTCRLLPSK